ncbi:MAG TPA: VC0807 family protein [Opitutus sp.]|nr:VC0807 family protein [Opitutus sp.]
MSLSPDPQPRPAAPAPPKPENLLVNLLCNVALPAVIMAQLSKENRLGPAWGLVVALAFPVGYGIYDFIARKKTNLLSLLGFVGVLLSGVLGLLKLDGRWFAIKDAAIPTLIGIILLATMRTREPLVKMLFFNDTIMDVPRVEAALRQRGAEAGFAALLRQCTVLVALSFFLSAALAYALARWLLTSPGGTPEFNAELAKMHWLSWPVIVIPSMAMLMIALWRLLGGLTKLTGLTSDEVFRADKKK